MTPVNNPQNLDNSPFNKNYSEVNYPSRNNQNTSGSFSPNDSNAIFSLMVGQENKTEIGNNKRKLGDVIDEFTQSLPENKKIKSEPSIKLEHFNEIPEEILNQIFKFSNTSNAALVSKHCNFLNSNSDLELFCELLNKDVYKNVFELLIPEDQQVEFKNFLVGKQSFIDWNIVENTFWTDFKTSISQFSPAMEIDKENFRTIFDSILCNYYTSYINFYNKIFDQNQLNLSPVNLSPSADSRESHAEQIDKIQEWFKINSKALSNINDLNLSKSNLTFLPREISLLSNLHNLTLEENRLTYIPDAIFNLKNLNILDLTNNQLNSISKKIGDLTHLRFLHLNDNKITSIPESIGNLTGLEALDFSNNNITSIPDAIGKLTGLTTLHLAKNNITSIPDAIGKLTALTYLRLNDNQLTSIIETIFNLTNLENLYLCNNRLTDIPVKIDNLTKMYELSLSNNNLTSIPEAIGKLKDLKYLHLINNQITTIPKAIGSLTDLKYLYLNKNKLISIPNEINKLKKLKHLFLENNQLKSIPNEIGNLTGLLSLNLSNNQLTSSPDEITAKLINLTSLDVSNNPFNFEH